MSTKSIFELGHSAMFARFMAMIIIVFASIPSFANLHESLSSNDGSRTWYLGWVSYRNTIERRYPLSRGGTVSPNLGEIREHAADELKRLSPMLDVLIVRTVAVSDNNTRTAYRTARAEFYGHPIVIHEDKQLSLLVAVAVFDGAESETHRFLFQGIEYSLQRATEAYLNMPTNSAFSTIGIGQESIAVPLRDILRLDRSGFDLSMSALESMPFSQFIDRATAEEYTRNLKPKLTLTVASKDIRASVTVEDPGKIRRILGLEKPTLCKRWFAN